MLSKLVHLKHISLGIVLILFGKSKVDNLVSLNADLPMDSTVFGMKIDVKLLQRLNALSPIEVTLDGITTVSIEEQLLKVFRFIEVID